MATTLKPKLWATTCLLSLASLASANDLIFSGFTMDANGHATLQNANLVLTNPQDVQQASAAYIDQAIPLTATTSFNLMFEFQISPATTQPADGMAVVFQNDPRATTALGVAGGYLGLGTNGTPGSPAAVSPSLAVELDIYRNGWSTEPNNNHIAIVVDGNVASTLSTNNNPGFNLDNGDPGYMWIDYDGIADQLFVYINSTNTKPGTPILTHNMDLFTALGGQMYVGFTAGTGSLRAVHQVNDMRFTPSTDLALSLTPSTLSPLPGQSLSFSITVSNNTSSAANDLTLSLHIPTGLDYQGINVTGWSCTLTGQQLDCTLPSLAAGTQSSLNLQTNVTQYGTFSLVGDLISNLPDNNSANNRGISATVAAVAVVPTTSTIGLILLFLLLAGMATYRLNPCRAT